MSAVELEILEYEYRGRTVRCPEWVEIPADNIFEQPKRRLVTCKRRCCRRCGPPWARDVETRVRVNLGVEGRMIMVTITAPGEELLPWDEEHCGGRHRYGGKHSGKVGCRVDPWRAAQWCDSRSYRWQKLRNAAQQATRRAMKEELGLDRQPRTGARMGVLVWEPQKRGVPHAHLIVAYNTPHDRMAAHFFVRELKRLAPAYEFGFIDARGKNKKQPRKDDPDYARRGIVHDRYGVPVREVDAEKAAWYLASYLAGRNPKKTTVRENISNPAMPISLVWVAPRLTRITGVTARALRKARHLRAWLLKRVDVAPKWHSLDEAVRIAMVYLQAFRSRPPPASEELALVLDFSHRVQRDVTRRIPWNDFQPQIVELALDLAESAMPAVA